MEFRFIKNNGNHKDNGSRKAVLCISSQGIWECNLKSGICIQVFSLGVAHWYTQLLATDTANANWLATSEDHAGIVKLFNNHSGKRVLICHNADFVNDLAFSLSFVATGGDRGIVQIWDRRHGELVERLYGLTSNVSSLAFHPDGFSLAAADNTGQLLVLSQRGEFYAQSLSRSTNKIAFTPDGSTLVSAGNDGKLTFWSRLTWESGNVSSRIW